MSRFPRFLPLLALSACYPVQGPRLEGLTSFDVRVGGIYIPAAGARSRQALPVVTACARQYGGAEQVPSAERGTERCPYAMPRGPVEVEVTAVALDRHGVPMHDFFGPVSFRVVPGDLTGDYPLRWAQAVDGVAKGTVHVAHLFGEVRVWAEDAPPQPIYSDGGITGTTQNLPVEPERRTYATGISTPVVFEEPTVAKLQIPDGFDNRSSPLVGQFVTIGTRPESKKVLRQSCPDDPANDGKEPMMVVTGTDPSGFFVTDLTACRTKEDVKDPVTGSTLTRVPEPDGYLPGAFGSMFIYNYSFPEGLYAGDLLATLSGAVQELTGTTQLTFPAWSLRERVHALPVEEWRKYLDQVKPLPLNLRHCGLDDLLAPFLTDTMCGHNRRNMKLESLESGLVKLRNVRFPDTFGRCDLNADGNVPFFCEGLRPTSQPPTPCRTANDCAVGLCDRQTSVCAEWGWGSCDFEGGPEDPAEQEERDCHIACLTGTGEFAGKRCTELATYDGFGQFAVELAGPGAAEAGLDATLPARTQWVPLSATSARVAASSAGAELSVWCEGPAWVRFGDPTVVATPADTPVLVRSLLRRRLGPGETHLALLANGAPGGARCAVAENPHVRINLITRDAVPRLEPNCSTTDADPDRAAQCRSLRAATFDVVGHLRHLQPGRPRWAVIPRDVDDLCCRPGPGLGCPRPIKPCTD